jgi:competence protein ComEA
MASPLERFSHAIIIGLAALLVAAVIALVVQQRDSGRPLAITVAGTPTTSGPMMAYITGAVAQPGVYQVADGDRLVDLLNKAGGAAADANLAAVNLAQRLHDEDRVIVPRAGEAASATTPVSQVAGAITSGSPININTASAQDLDSLPGIGQVYSQRIVDSRTNAGPFVTTDDLVTRQLVPRATYDKIRDLISVGP